MLLLGTMGDVSGDEVPRGGDTARGKEFFLSSGCFEMEGGVWGRELRRTVMVGGTSSKLSAEGESKLGLALEGASMSVDWKGLNEMTGVNDFWGAAAAEANVGEVEGRERKEGEALRPREKREDPRERGRLIERRRPKISSASAS